MPRLASRRWKTNRFEKNCKTGAKPLFTTQEAETVNMKKSPYKAPMAVISVQMGIGPVPELAMETAV
ncbi:MAG: hypothetical protein LBU06_05615 [Desulfovibrio sp.]|jgi:hypothetical protein|nr:hypothetical protein [Desulfovibrio sp.]